MWCDIKKVCSFFIFEYLVKYERAELLYMYILYMFTRPFHEWSEAHIFSANIAEVNQICAKIYAKISMQHLK